MLIKLLDYLGALEAYEADVAAGAIGSNLRNAKLNIATLGAVRTTFLELTVSDGPAVIHLDSRTQRVFCTAEPTCHQGWLPGAYKVLADRAGYQPWSRQVTLVAGKTARLAITLVEKPSALTVRVAQAGATIIVDDEIDSPATAIPAGSHRVAVKLAGHVTSSTEIVAREGKPIDLEVSLTPRVAIRVEPATAALRLDDRPIAVEDAGLAVPPGHHVLVARAPGLADRRIDIPADRPADYAIVVELSRAVPTASGTVFTHPPQDRAGHRRRQPDRGRGWRDPRYAGQAARGRCVRALSVADHAVRCGRRGERAQQAGPVARAPGQRRVRRRWRRHDRDHRAVAHRRAGVARRGHAAPRGGRRARSQPAVLNRRFS